MSEVKVEVTMGMGKATVKVEKPVFRRLKTFQIVPSKQKHRRVKK